jgi:hypothetical protein
LFDQIHRLVCRFVGELQHVIEPMLRVRHFFLGKIDQARIDAEALERRLQIGRELAQLTKQFDLATLYERIELRVKHRLIAGRKGVAERSDARAVFFLQYCESSSHS